MVAKCTSQGFTNAFFAQFCELFLELSTMLDFVCTRLFSSVAQFKDNTIPRDYLCLFTNPQPPLRTALFPLCSQSISSSGFYSPSIIKVIIVSPEIAIIP
jgi:hypothetical protein